MKNRNTLFISVLCMFILENRDNIILCVDVYINVVLQKVYT